MNHDGITDIGLFVPTSSPGSARRAAIGTSWNPRPRAPRRFRASHPARISASINAIAHPFNPRRSPRTTLTAAASSSPLVGNGIRPPPSPPVIKLARARSPMSRFRPGGQRPSRALRPAHRPPQRQRLERILGRAECTSAGHRANPPIFERRSANACLRHSIAGFTPGSTPA